MILQNVVDVPSKNLLSGFLLLCVIAIVSFRLPADESERYNCPPLTSQLAFCPQHYPSPTFFLLVTLRPSH